MTSEITRDPIIFLKLLKLLNFVHATNNLPALNVNFSHFRFTCFPIKGNKLSQTKFINWLSVKLTKRIFEIYSGINYVLISGCELLELKYHQL